MQKVRRENEARNCDCADGHRMPGFRWRACCHYVARWDGAVDQVLEVYELRVERCINLFTFCKLLAMIRVSRIADWRKDGDQ